MRQVLSQFHHSIFTNNVLETFVFFGGQTKAETEQLPPECCWWQTPYCFANKHPLQPFKTLHPCTRRAAQPSSHAKSGCWRTNRRGLGNFGLPIEPGEQGTESQGTASSWVFPPSEQCSSCPVTYLVVTLLTSPQALWCSGTSGGGSTGPAGPQQWGFVTSFPWRGTDTWVSRTKKEHHPTDSFSLKIFRWELKEWDLP